MEFCHRPGSAKKLEPLYYGNKEFIIVIETYANIEELGQWGSGRLITESKDQSVINTSEALVQVDKSQLYRETLRTNTSGPWCGTMMGELMKSLWRIPLKYLLPPHSCCCCRPTAKCLVAPGLGPPHSPALQVSGIQSRGQAWWVAWPGVLRNSQAHLYLSDSAKRPSKSTGFCSTSSF